MKRFYRMFTCFVLVLLFGPFPATGQQEPGGLYLTGKITTEQGSVNGATIRMTRNGQPMKDYQVLPDGKFDLRFEFNNDYVLVFQRSDNFPQKIVITTHVPAEVLRRDRKFPPFPVDVNLFTEIKGVDRTFADNAIMKIYYSPSVDNFIPELYYNNAQIKRLIDQAIWQSQNVRREADLLKKLSAAELAELKKEYDELLKKAGTEFDRGEYIASLGDYKSASRIFPTEQYPKDRIAEINDLIAILGLQAELDKQNAEKYNGYIREADRQFGLKSWPGARENYLQALFVKPGDSYATGRLTEIEQAVALEEKALQDEENARREAERQAQMLADLEKQYGEALSLADQAFTRQEYPQAITGYRNALRIKPGESYPTSRITEAETIMAELAAARKAYDNAISEGDKAFRQQNYRQARKAFEEAQKAMSNEPYPARMLEKIDAIDEELLRLAEEKSKEEARKAAEELAARMAAEAEKLRLAEEQTRREQEEQARLLAEQALRDQQYESTIRDADRLATENLLVEAVGKFRAALEIKPRESYPIQRIEEIRGIIARQNETRKAFEAAVALGDQEFKKQNYGPARKAFQEALNHLPGETYPEEMISRITSLEAEQMAAEAEKARLAAEKAAREEAARLAAEAEKQRIAEEQARAEAERLARLEAERQAAEAEKVRLAAEKAAREEAARLAAEAEKQRIAEEQARVEAERLARLEAERQAAEAEKARLAAEKAAREEAARLAAEAEKQRIAEEQARVEAERLARLEAERQAAEAEKARLAAEKAAREEAARLAAEAELEKRYADAVAAGDKFFNEKQYSPAIGQYRAALREKPQETYPRQRIAESETLLANLAAAQKAYEEAIADGDREFRRQQYSAAREAFLRAQQAKSGEGYPGEMIARIDALLAEQARAAEEQARVEAEKQRIAEEQARAEAERLARLEAERQAAEAEKARLAAEKAAREEAARLAAEAELEKRYADAVAAGDKFFNEKQYSPAIGQYRAALREKPQETYPRQRIAESETLLANLAAAQKAYEEAIADGDREFRRQQYSAAREAFLRAQQAKSGEGYPGEMIARIDALLAEQARAAEEQARVEAEKQRIAEEQARAEAERLARLEAERQAAEAEKARLAAQKEAESAARTKIMSDETEALYAGIIATADQAFTEKEYNVSRAWYYKALEVKPGEAYPTGRITEINMILGSQQMSQREREFQGYIDKGDEAFRAGEMAVARGWYNRSLSIRPDDEYARAQIADIQMKIAEKLQGHTETSFLDYLREGDKALSGKNYNVARVWYHRARQLKPDDTRVAEKLQNLEKAMGGE